MTRIPTIPFDEVREFYTRSYPRGGWFSRGTMLPRIAYETNAGVLFITSEVTPSGDKRYTVRRQLPDGSIVTVGELHQFPTRAAAIAEIRRLHRQGG